MFPSLFKGLDRYACRKQLIAELESEGTLTHADDHIHNVGACYRCQTVIEPYLSKQWFVDMKQCVEPAIQAVRDKSIRFVPDRWEKLLF